METNSSALSGLGPVLQPQICAFHICPLINAAVNIIGLESVPPLLPSWQFVETLQTTAGLFLFAKRRNHEGIVQKRYVVFYIAGSFIGQSFLTRFCPVFYAQCDELHWSCSVLHVFIWILVEQTHNFLCTFKGNSALLEMAIPILCILPFVVLCLHSYIFNKNLLQKRYFVSLRKVMESLPDEMIKYSSLREQRCINRCESNYE